MPFRCFNGGKDLGLPGPSLRFWFGGTRALEGVRENLQMSGIYLMAFGKLTEFDENTI
jgi:hypothetical protein